MRDVTPCSIPYGMSQLYYCARAMHAGSYSEQYSAVYTAVPLQTTSPPFPPPLPNKKIIDGILCDVYL